MKFSAAAVLAVAAGASAWENVTYTTEVVTALTTFCPEATTLTHAGTTYTVSSVCLRQNGHGLNRDGIGRALGLELGNYHEQYRKIFEIWFSAHPSLSSDLSSTLLEIREL